MHYLGCPCLHLHLLLNSITLVDYVTPTPNVETYIGKNIKISIFINIFATFHPSFNFSTISLIYLRSYNNPTSQSRVCPNLATQWIRRSNQIFRQAQTHISCQQPIGPATITIIPNGRPNILHEPRLGLESQDAGHHDPCDASGLLMDWRNESEVSTRLKPSHAMCHNTHNNLDSLISRSMRLLRMALFYTFAPLELAKRNHSPKRSLQSQRRKLKRLNLSLCKNRNPLNSLKCPLKTSRPSPNL